MIRCTLQLCHILSSYCLKLLFLFLVFISPPLSLVILDMIIWLRITLRNIWVIHNTFHSFFMPYHQVHIHFWFRVCHQFIRVLNWSLISLSCDVTFIYRIRRRKVLIMSNNKSFLTGCIRLLGWRNCLKRLKTWSSSLLLMSDILLLLRRPWIMRRCS